jgi:hypothetical protein
MPSPSPLRALPDQFLDALGLTQKMVLANAMTLITPARALAPTIPSQLATCLPDVVGLTADSFRFAEKLMANQRQFAVNLLTLCLPTNGTHRVPTSSKRR